jgi:hypothetical protein
VVRMTRTLLAIALVVSPLFCEAQAPAVLGKCIVGSLSAKDRSDLARWVFLSMSTHPDMRQFSNASAESREDTSRAVGVLFTRLMTRDCAGEMQEAARAGAPPVVPSAIQFLTQIGVQELMTSRDVLNTLSSFSRFADKERIDGASRRR